MIRESKLSCNCCNSSVEGIAWKTTCKHFFCPDCAHKSFQNANICPICSKVLALSDVQELNVGIVTSNLSDMMYQSVLQNSSFDFIASQSIQLQQLAFELNEFVHTQTTFEIERRSVEKDLCIEELNNQISAAVITTTSALSYHFFINCTDIFTVIEF